MKLTRVNNKNTLTISRPEAEFLTELANLDAMENQQPILIVISDLVYHVKVNARKLVDLLKEGEIEIQGSNEVEIKVLRNI